MPEPDACTEAREAWGRTVELPGHVRTHIATCRGCQVFVRGADTVGQRLDRFGTQSAPPKLRASVTAMLDGNAERARASGLRRFAAPVSLLALAAVLTIIIAGTAPVAAPTIEFGSLTAAAIWDQPTDRTEATDPDVLRTWFADHYEYAVDIPEIPGGNPTGATVVSFEGSPTAAISYDMGGTQLTYLVLRAERVMNRSVANGAGPFYMAETGGHAVLWGWGESARILMGDLPAADLLSLAERCRRQERGQI